MKILLAVHHFPPRYSAGAELYTFRLARWLIANGHEAEVVCVERLDPERAPALDAWREDYAGIPVYRLSLGTAGAPYSWSYDHPQINAWIRAHLGRSRPDLVHLHSGYLIGAGAINEAHHAGIPTVVTLHDYWFLCPRITLLRGDGRICAEAPADPAGCAWCLKLDQRRYSLPDRVSGGLAEQAWLALAAGAARDEQATRRAALSRALGHASLVLAPSRFLANKFAGAVAPERIRVLGLGIEMAGLRQAPPAGRQRPLRLGFIGQIAAHKGADILVRAVAGLPAQGRPLTLSLHGDLDQHRGYSDRLRRLAAGDPRITLAGRFENSTIGAVLGALDVVVVPSIWYENSPLVILEAQAAGRPVVTAAMGGMAELVRHEVDGLHFRPGDDADLARQIQRLRDEPELLERLVAGTPSPPSLEDEMRALSQHYARLARASAPAAVEVA